jgi:hypothetical protein
VTRFRNLGAVALLCLTTTHSVWAEAQHTLGPSYQLTIINTKQNNESVLQAAGVTYAASLGGAWGFQGVFTAYFPISAYQNGKYVSVADTYSSAWGIDAIFAAMRRLCFLSNLQVDLGLGPHIDGLVMKGKRFANSGFSDFNSFTLGIGASAVVRWRVGSGPVTVGAFGNGAVDFVDLLHGGDLSVGYGVTAGALVGVDL